MKYSIKCPTCGQHTAEITLTTAPAIAGVQVQCVCGAEGPICESHAEAWEQWLLGARASSVSNVVPFVSRRKSDAWMWRADALQSARAFSE